MGTDTFWDVYPREREEPVCGCFSTSSSLIVVEDEKLGELSSSELVIINLQEALLRPRVSLFPKMQCTYSSLSIYKYIYIELYINIPRKTSEINYLSSAIPALLFSLIL